MAETDPSCRYCTYVPGIGHSRGCVVAAFPERLRVEMARRQMTQEDLALRLGYTQTAVSYWTTGKRRPSLADLVVLADLFDVSTDYLLGRAEVTASVPERSDISAPLTEQPRSPE